MKNLDRWVLPYMAGIVDGEGSVCLSRKSPNENRRPTLTVPSTTFEIVSWLKGAFGGCISSKRKNKAHHSPSWIWAIEGNKALEVMDEILPYMLEPRKRARIILLGSDYKRLTKRNGRYTDQELREKKLMEKRFFEL